MLFDSVKQASEISDDVRFKCPSANLESMMLRGHYYAPNFDYIAIKVLSCNLEPDEFGNERCATSEELLGTVITMLSVKAIPNIGADDVREMVSYTVD